MVGQVHDENAYALGGVSGHAGLFSTAADLGRFGQMLLDKGEGGGAAILSPESVALLDRPQIPAIEPFQCIGWRRRTMLDSPIGFLGSPRAFGHTGFTGTSMWLDPDNQVVAVLLTNAVHPERARAHAQPVRKRFHGAIVTGLKQTPAKVRSGLDVLEAEEFRRLKGLRVAVVTNQTAVNAGGAHLLELITRRRRDFDIAMIISPEHGFDGTAGAGQSVEDSSYGPYSIISLYGGRRRLNSAMCDFFDVMLYDIQDVGARFYTYIWTLRSIQESCAMYGKRLIVLDRPNPLGGHRVEGPILKRSHASFVGLKPIPTRYGLTCGELATLFNQQRWLWGGQQADLEVIRMEGWRREMPFHQTGLPWVAPSPNIPTWDSAAVYPGTCVFEGTQWSEGRGDGTSRSRWWAAPGWTRNAWREN